MQKKAENDTITIRRKQAIETGLQMLTRMLTADKYIPCIKIGQRFKGKDGK